MHPASIKCIHHMNGLRKYNVKHTRREQHRSSPDFHNHKVKSELYAISNQVKHLHITDQSSIHQNLENQARGNLFLYQQNTKNYSI